MVNVSRQELICIPSLFILSCLFGMTGLMYAQPATDILSIIGTFALYKVMKKTRPNQTKPESNQISMEFRSRYR